MFKNGKELKINTNMNCKAKIISCTVSHSHDAMRIIPFVVDHNPRNHNLLLLTKQYLPIQTGSKLINVVRVHKQQVKDSALRNVPYSEHLELFVLVENSKCFLFSKIKEENK